MQITEYTTASHRYAQGDSVQIDEFLSMRDVADMPELQSNVRSIVPLMYTSVPLTHRAIRTQS
jgi:hypothetical protein